MAKNKRETLAQTSKSADKTPSLALMIGLPTPFNPTMQTQTKNSNGDSSRKTKIYALLRNVLRPVVAASPAGVGSRLLVAAGAGFLTVVEGT